MKNESEPGSGASIATVPSDPRWAAVPNLAWHWYDFICPFCYVGQHRSKLLGLRGLHVVHLPYQGQPEIPPEGVYPGSRVGPTFQLLEEQARAAGLLLRWPSRLPNTRRALAVSEWVRHNQPEAFAELYASLFGAHFVNSEKLDDFEVLERHASSAGVDVDRLRKSMADGSAYHRVGESEEAGHRFGVRGTPAWLIRGHLLIGLQPPIVFERFAALPPPAKANPLEEAPKNAS